MLAAGGPLEGLMPGYGDGSACSGALRDADRWPAGEQIELELAVVEEAPIGACHQ